MSTGGKHGLHPVAKRPKTTTEKLKDHLADGGEEYSSGARGGTPAIIGMEKADTLVAFLQKGNVGESDEDYLKGWVAAPYLIEEARTDKEYIDKQIDEHLENHRKYGYSLDATHPDNANMFRVGGTTFEPSSKDFRKLTRAELFMSYLDRRSDFRLLSEKDQYAVLELYKEQLEKHKDDVESYQSERGGSPEEWGGKWTPVEHMEDAVQNLADDIEDINKLKDAVARKDIEAIKKIPTHIRVSSRFDRYGQGGSSTGIPGTISREANAWQHGAKYITDWREAKKLNPRFSTGEAKQFALTNIARDLSHPSWQEPAYEGDDEFFPRGSQWPHPDMHRDYGDTGESHLGPSRAQGTYFRDMMVMHSAAMYGDQEAKYKLLELSTDPEGDKIRYPHVNPKPGAVVPGIDVSAKEALPVAVERDLDIRPPDPDYDPEAPLSGQVGTVEEERRGRQPGAFPSTREWKRGRAEGNPRRRFSQHEQRRDQSLQDARRWERPRQPRSWRFFRHIPQTGWAEGTGETRYPRSRQRDRGSFDPPFVHGTESSLENVQSYPIDAPRRDVPKLMEEFKSSERNRWVDPNSLDNLWDNDNSPEDPPGTTDPNLNKMQKANIQKAEETRKRLEDMTGAEKVKAYKEGKIRINRSYRQGQPQHPQFAEEQTKIDETENIDKALFWPTHPKENGKGRKVKTRVGDSIGGYPT